MLSRGTAYISVHGRVGLAFYTLTHCNETRKQFEGMKWYRSVLLSISLMIGEDKHFSNVLWLSGFLLDELVFLALCLFSIGLIAFFISIFC